jgi:hypothetical protein
MVANALNTATRNVTIGDILADIRGGKWAGEFLAQDMMPLAWFGWLPRATGRAYAAARASNTSSFHISPVYT